MEREYFDRSNSRSDPRQRTKSKRLLRETFDERIFAKHLRIQLNGRTITCSGNHRCSFNDSSLSGTREYNAFARIGWFTTPSDSRKTRRIAVVQTGTLGYSARSSFVLFYVALSAIHL